MLLLPYLPPLMVAGLLTLVGVALLALAVSLELGWAQMVKMTRALAQKDARRVSERRQWRRGWGGGGGLGS